jgi:hypothetical protein
MVKVTLCDPFFWEQPSLLVGNAWWRRWSRDHRASCASEIVNEIAAVYVFTLFFGAILSVVIEYPFGLPMALAISTLYLFPAFMTLYDIQGYYNCDKNLKETFTGGGSEQINTNTPLSSDTTNPTATNPFMNVLVDEIKYNPTRPQAASIQSSTVNDTLDAFFKVQWSSDPTDVFGRTQSQRQFVAMPSTSIPNDQGSYQNWLYKIPGKTCKEGGRQACLPGTDGAVVPWLSTNA